MKKVVLFSLFFAVLFASGLTYAAVDQSSGRTDSQSGSNGFFASNRPHAVFAGPKVGWLTVPEEEAASAVRPDQDTR